MIYLMLSLALMTLDHRGHYLERFRDVSVAVLAEPVRVLVETPFRLVRRGLDWMQARNRLVSERDQLRRLVEQYQARDHLTDDLARENQRLRQLLDASQRLEQAFQTVELRGVDLDPYSHRLLIDRGSIDGLAEGQPVMDAFGLVGQVERVGQRSAEVILLSDPDHALPVEVARNALRTIAYGSGRGGELRLTDLSMNADIRSGDLLLTSGLGGRFPPGLPVAEIVAVRRPQGEAFAVATAATQARLIGTRHLLVLTGPSPARTVPVDQDASPTGNQPMSGQGPRS